MREFTARSDVLL